MNAKAACALMLMFNALLGPALNARDEISSVPNVVAVIETVEIVEEMFVKKLADLAPRDWTKSTLQGLRRTLIRAMEQHVERKFLTVPLLEAL